MKALVAFYSRADENYFGGAYRYVEVGNTERAAREIAKETGADLFHIQQVQPYAAEYRTCVAQARGFPNQGASGGKRLAGEFGCL